MLAEGETLELPGDGGREEDGGVPLADGAEVPDKTAPATTTRVEATIKIATDIARALGPRPTARCIVATDGVDG